MPIHERTPTGCTPASRSMSRLGFARWEVRKRVRAALAPACRPPRLPRFVQAGLRTCGLTRARERDGGSPSHGLPEGSPQWLADPPPPTYRCGGSAGLERMSLAPASHFTRRATSLTYLGRHLNERESVLAGGRRQSWLLSRRPALAKTTSVTARTLPGRALDRPRRARATAKPRSGGASAAAEQSDSVCRRKSAGGDLAQK
jgi:hypothetical protein